MGYQNLRIESTITMVLVLYHSALCPNRLIPIFQFFLPFFTFFLLAPPNLGVFGLSFAFRNDYHIIVDVCGSSMVCMHPWCSCSLGLHALFSLLYWVRFVDKRGKENKIIKIACRAADCMELLSPNPALYGGAPPIMVVRF